MLIDSIQLIEGSSITNPVIASGTTFPSNPSVGELFFRTDEDATYIHSGTIWGKIGTGVDAVESVAGQVGVVVLTKTDVGLANVDNTSDAAKPVSTATQTALNAKQATLISNTNIKTVGGVSLLGAGDIAVGTGDVTLAGAQTLTNKTISGASNTITDLSLTAAVIGSLPVANGGTGVSTAQGAINALAGGVTANRVLRANGSNVVLAQVELSTDVTGSLSVTNGGTGAATLTGIVKGNGASAFTAVAAPAGALVGTTDTQTLSGKSLTNPTVTDYVEALFTQTAGTTFTINLTNGTIQRLTTTGNATVTLPASVAGKSFVLLVAYGGVHTITWAGGGTLKWAGGAAPVPTSVNGKFDMFVFTCDGINTYGRSSGSNF